MAEKDTRNAGGLPHVPSLLDQARLTGPIGQTVRPYTSFST